MTYPLQAPFMEPFGNREHTEKGACECQPADGGHLLGKEIQQSRCHQHQQDQTEADWNFHIPPADVERHLELARRAILEAQYHHGHGLEDETPHDAKGISLAQQNHVAAADQDRR